MFARGADFFAAFASFQPDLILLDLNLPDIDGLDVCWAARDLAAYIPILMLTARSEPVDKLIGFEAGADIYLIKPYDPRELLAQIKAIFRLIERHGHSQAEGGAGRLTELPLTNGPLMM